jgi:regulator of sigma E protease
MVFFEYTIWLLILIGIMILVHELGHFWAARYFDVKVEAFSLGFGPRVFGFHRGETDYRISAIPFGGYVKMVGEQPGEDGTEDPRSFQGKPRWQRLIIAFAGPFMNIVLAVALLTGLYMFKFQRLEQPAVRSVIGYVQPGSPAARAGIQEGDRIVEINGKVEPIWEDVVLEEFKSAYHTLRLTVERDGRRFQSEVRPELDPRTGVGSAGWSERTDVQLGAISPNMPAEKAGLRRGDQVLRADGQPILSVIQFHEMIRGTGGKPLTLELLREGEPSTITVQPVFTSLDGTQRWMIGAVVEPKLNVITTQLSFTEALNESVRQNVKGATLIYQFLRAMVEQRASAKSLTGPIGIAQLSGEAAREGMDAYIMLMSMVSLNLAIFNLLPIPILDGGVIVMLLVEMLMRRDLSMRVKEAVFKLGFVFIMVLVAFVLYNDISKILPSGS